MPDAYIRKQKIAAGKTEALREWMTDLKQAVEGNEAEVLEVWREEGLHTISLFIERGDGLDHLVWYVEAEDIDKLVRAREESTSPLHDLEDEMLADVLESPDEAGEFELLAHGVSPERTDTFSFE